MVEGPGATRNGRKISCILGHVVTNAEFPNASNLTADIVTGRRLTDCFSVGKELFLVFSGECDGDEMALRLHFGMDGCLHVEYVGSASSGVSPWRRDERPSMRLFVRRSGEASEDSEDFDKSPMAMTSEHFTKSCGMKEKQPEMQHAASNDPTLVVETRGTTVSGPLSASLARQKYFRLSTQDPCSPTFDPTHVFQKLREASTNPMISDALLNQEIFPGVGNVIKIEALHRTKVDPRRTVPSLSDQELRELIQNCRDFSLSWLNNGRTPERLVYNKTVCGTCNNASVSMRKLGGNPSSDNTAYMARVTFWCTICQPSRASPSEPSPPIPPPEARVFSCPHHGPTGVVLRRVKKTDSPNFLRLFRTCRRKGCDHFVWADGGFPLCSCGKKAVLRVSKTQMTGGRWFFCCRGNGWGRSNDRRNGCGLFQWVDEELLSHLGPGLTPLL